jgi:multiple sugar transport system permease protein
VALTQEARQPVTQAARPRMLRRSPRRRLGQDPFWMKVLIYMILILGSLIFIAPMAWMVVASFKPLKDMFAWPPNWIPTDPTISNYTRFLGLSGTEADKAQAGNVLRWFFNSTFVTLSIIVIQTFFSSMAAYCFAKRQFPGRDFLFLLGLGTMAIPAAVFLIPNYLVLKHVPLFGGNDLFGNGGHGWLDSYWGLIIPNCVNMFTIFMLRQYMRTIPDELLDAARVDGAGHFRIYWTVVLPLCRPALAATAIFAFNSYWNSFLGPLIILSSPDKFTVPVGLALYVVKNRTAWDLVMAGSVLATLPVVLSFLFFQRYFVRGIAISGLK